MNIRAKIFGTGRTADESPLVQSKAPRGVKADSLNSIAVPREESRRANTRDQDRHRLPDEQVHVTHKRKSHEVKLVNLSGGGAMIEGEFEPMLWDRIDLHLGENGTIECAVRWIKGGRVGLEFAHETRIDCSAAQRTEVLRAVIARSFPDVQLTPVDTDVPVQSGDADEEHRNGGRRHPLIWSGLIHHDFLSTEVRLRNISETGAMIECAAPPPVGAEPLLELGPECQIFATVVWVVGDSVGLKFTRPFDLGLLANVRPDVAANSWQRPSYLQAGAAADSPWDEQWERMSVSELRQSLEGFMKH
jgi:hypothetical protein